MFSSFKCTDFSFRIHFLKFVLKYDNYFFQALGKDFHSEHFVCVSCNLSLTGHRYVLTGKRMISRKKIFLCNLKKKLVFIIILFTFSQMSILVAFPAMSKILLIIVEFVNGE